MKTVSILYNIIFNLLVTLGFPLSITTALTTMSLIAISIGLLIVVPELVLLIAMLVLIGLFSG